MSETSPRAVILFDIDGTMLKGAGYQHRDALIEGVRRATNVTASFDGIDTAGRLDRDLIAALLTKSGVSLQEVSASVESIAGECCKAYLSDCEGDLSHCVLPGVKAFLEKAASHGVVLGVVSGNLRTIGLKKLERAGLLHYFSVNAFSDDGHTRAELARLAADEARDTHGIDEWAPIFLIGDHLNDIEAARTNGFYSIAVATGVIAIEQLNNCEPTMAVADLTGLHPGELIDLYRG